MLSLSLSRRPPMALVFANSLDPAFGSYSAIKILHYKFTAEIYCVLPLVTLLWAVKMKLKEKQLQLQSHIHIPVLWVQELSLLSYISPLAIVVLLNHQFPFCEEISFFFLPISLPFVLFISAQEEPAYSWIQISSCKMGDFSNWGKWMLWLQSMVLHQFSGFDGCISSNHITNNCFETQTNMESPFLNPKKWQRKKAPHTS